MMCGGRNTPTPHRRRSETATSALTFFVRPDDPATWAAATLLTRITSAALKFVFRGGRRYGRSVFSFFAVSRTRKYSRLDFFQNDLVLFSNYVYFTYFVWNSANAPRPSVIRFFLSTRYGK